MFLDGQFVGNYRALNKWQSVAVEINATASALSCLEIRESPEGANSGGDGFGPLLDNISLVPVKRLSFENPSFEDGIDSTLDPFYQIDEIPDWLTDGPTDQRTVRIRKGGPFVPDGDHYLTIDGNTDRYDRIFHSLPTDASKNYFLAFDMRSDVGDFSLGNQLRVRWNGSFADVHAATTLWQTHVVSLAGEIDGISWLDLREAPVNGNYFGDGLGPWVDNFRWYELDTSAASTAIVTLTDSGSISSEQTVNIDLNSGGSRLSSVSFDLTARFDFSDKSSISDDLFNVYIVDPISGDLLLDNGTPGGALFSFDGADAEFPAGRVRFDGREVAIDVSALSEDLANVDLLVQLIDADGDDQSRIHVGPIRALTGGGSSPAILRSSLESTVGPAIDISGFSKSTDFELEIQNAILDGGRFFAELVLTNISAVATRSIAVAFANLPAGVGILNASGFDANGNPYLNLAEAVSRGGLMVGESASVPIEVTTPSLEKFGLYAEVMVGDPNRTPEFPEVGDIQIRPGEFKRIDLAATDLDGDQVTYRIIPGNTMPTLALKANGFLEFAPRPDEIGNYQFIIEASDGASKIERTVNVAVVDDPVTTTRISGVVLNTDEAPLPGIVIELGNLQAITDATGAFMIESPGPLPSDTLKIRGETWMGGGAYPFVAEKLELLFGRDPFPNVNNEIGRPIYLPELDLAQGDVVDPNSNSIVDATLRSGETPAQVFVSQGSLQDQQGNPFSGIVSITEVPRDLTPAALPFNFLPDVVVTIQPGEMVFTDPARLTLPNRAGYAHGSVVDLWSINPVTGQFDDVGNGLVQGDRIITTSGGIRNSSWHFFAQPAPVIDPVVPQNENNDCEECKKTVGNFEVELHSGAVLEDYSLVSYQSAGTTWSWGLHYDSLRADPRPIVHLGYSNLQPSATQLLVGRLQFSNGNQTYQVPGYNGSISGLSGGEHFWKLDATGSGRVALQADLTSFPTGNYRYEFTSGLLQFDGNEFSGTTTTQFGEIRHVNLSQSPFGAGWGLSGLQHIVENSDGSLLLIDGGGSELYFGPPNAEGIYESPPGDFTTLRKDPNGRFHRTFKDQTVVAFNESNQIASVIDRNGNTTAFDYDQAGIISKITDPAGLETVFGIENGRVTSITDPAGRVTSLTFDSSGNLRLITDPDATKTRWKYDGEHRIISHRDKRGFTESVSYDFAGRAASSVRKDGTHQRYVPVQSNVVLPFATTIDPFNAPSVSTDLQAEGLYVDPNGNVYRSELDSQGQFASGADSAGNLGSTARNDDNLVVESIDGRGFSTQYGYDNRGNVVTIIDEVIAGASGQELLFPGSKIRVDGKPTMVRAADLNRDGVNDIVVVTDVGRISTYLAVGSGGFRLQQEIGIAPGPRNIQLGDINGDGFVDLISTNISQNSFDVFLNNELATFDLAATLATGNSNPAGAVIGDYDRDGDMDLAISHISGNVSVFSGDNLGNFTLVSELNSGTGANGIQQGDLDEDGVLDLVVANSSAGSISIFLGIGNGQFGLPTVKDVQGTSPIGLQVVDIDGNGILDIATSNFDSGDIAIFEGLGNGVFAEANLVATGGKPNNLRIVDVNGDGLLDLLAADTERDAIAVSVALGLGLFDTPQLVPVGEMPTSLETVDLNADGVVDLLSGNSAAGSQPGDLSIVFGIGNGEFDALTSYATGRNSAFATAVDINDDGILDILASNSADLSISILQGVGDGTLLPSTYLDTSGGSVESFLVEDFNQDGILDLAASQYATDRILIYIGTGGGSFAVPFSFISPNPRQIRSADINADGIIDLISVNDQGNTASVHYGVGDGGFGIHNDVPAGNLPISLDTADFNNDGVVDFVTTHNLVEDGVAVVLNNGDGTFQDPLIFPFSGQAGVRYVVVADLNMDGIQDLIYGRTDDLLAVNFGNGDGTFLAAETYELSGTGARYVDVSDINQDGIPDVVVTEYDLDSVAVFLGNGDGSLGAARPYGVGNAPLGVAAADFNQDGIVDLAVSNQASFDVSILLGKNPPITGPRYFQYDETYSQLIRSRDELGRVVLYEIDPGNGNRLAMQQVIGAVDSIENGETDDLITRYTYTTYGLVDTMTDPLGRVTDYEYDPLGRMIRVTYAVGTVDEAFVRYEYDPAGNQSLFVDENGNQTAFEYDSLNRLKKITEADPDGSGLLAAPLTLFGYDNDGNLALTLDALGHLTANAYDALGRLIETRDPLGNATKFRYDPYGNLVATIDPLGHTTRNEYDGRNRLVATIDPDGGRTEFDYDLDDNLTSLLDPVGNLTRFHYDARDRMIEEIDPLGASIRYAYDAVDNLINKLDRNGRLTEFVYDDVNRLVRELWFDESQSLTNEVVYEYDMASNLDFVNDYFSTLDFEYDHRNRVDSVDNFGTLDTPHVLVEYSYDGVGNVLSVTDTINGVAGAVTGYQYDGLNRLIDLNQSGNGVSEKAVVFAYNAIGQYTAIDRYSDLAMTNLVASTTYAYDRANRLTNLDHANAANDILGFYEFDYDNASRISRLADFDGITDYSYDDRNQLTGADRGDGDIRGDESYSFDPNGNRLESHRHDDGYVTGPANRLISDGTYDFDYDDEGNMIRRTEIATGDYRVFEWDNRNRMIAVTDFSATDVAVQAVQFVYDVLDRRITKIVDLDGDGAAIESSTHFVYDREDVILDFTDADGQGNGSQPVVEYRYLHGPEIDQVLAQESSETQWLLTDHLGSTDTIIATDGSLDGRYQFDDFGNIIAQSGIGNTRILFTGREFDAEINQVFFRTRSYFAETGRFLSEDWIGFLSGDLNPFRYVENSPTVFNDPFGFQSANFTFGAEFFAGAGAGFQITRVDGKTMCCIEVGVGAGGSANLGPASSLPDASESFGASFGASAGPAFGVGGGIEDQFVFDGEGYNIHVRNDSISGTIFNSTAKYSPDKGLEFSDVSKGGGGRKSKGGKFGATGKATYKLCY